LYIGTFKPGRDQRPISWLPNGKIVFPKRGAEVDYCTVYYGELVERERYAILMIKGTLKQRTEITVYKCGCKTKETRELAILPGRTRELGNNETIENGTLIVTENKDTICPECVEREKLERNKKALKTLKQEIQGLPLWKKILVIKEKMYTVFDDDFRKQAIDELLGQGWSEKIYKVNEDALKVLEAREHADMELVRQMEKEARELYNKCLQEYGKLQRLYDENWQAFDPVNQYELEGALAYKRLIKKLGFAGKLEVPTYIPEYETFLTYVASKNRDKPEALVLLGRKPPYGWDLPRPTDFRTIELSKQEAEKRAIDILVKEARKHYLNNDDEKFTIVLECGKYKITMNVNVKDTTTNTETQGLRIESATTTTSADIEIKVTPNKETNETALSIYIDISGLREYKGTHVIYEGSLFGGYDPSEDAGWAGGASAWFSAD